jgi:hypothetical protein
MPAERWSEEDLSRYLAKLTKPLRRPPEPRQAPSTPKPRKYRNEKITIDGRTFDSKKEAARFAELALLEKVGAIRDLECQPRYDLSVNGVVIGAYVADFRYYSVELGRLVVEDVKGMKGLPLYRWKIKHLLAEHAIKVVEVR